jgi:UDP-N-acetylglucosamine 2-epimerase (non-hydrolysing)
LVVVVRDLNPALASALVTVKLQAIAHVEAGLRSREHSMPEAISRSSPLLAVGHYALRPGRA